jgi:hypothetical protein
VVMGHGRVGVEKSKSLAVAPIGVSPSGLD